MTPKFDRTEARRVCGLLLLCALPLLAAGLFGRKENRPAFFSPQKLAKYTGIIPFGGSGFVRLGDQGFGGGEEGAWSITVSGPPHAIEAHETDTRGWKVQFVEELPDWNGTKTIGVRVWAPKSWSPGAARQAQRMGANMVLFHTRNGQQRAYGQGFQVQHPKAKRATVTRNRLDHERVRVTVAQPGCSRF